MLKRVVPVLFGMAALAIPGAAHAQTSLTQLMLDQFTKNIVLSQTPNGGGIASHTPEFQSSSEVQAVTGLVQQVSQQIAGQLSNTPLGSSSGGFTYRYDSSLGTFTRSTETFGPAFAERALTIGRKKFNFGMNFQHSKFSSLDGKDLENGEIRFYLPHQTLNPPSFVSGDMIEAAVNLKLRSDTTAFFMTYGVTDKLDIGVAVPFQRVRMDLTYHATILDFATHVTSPTTHVFDDGGKEDDFNKVATASGIGDVVVRAKFALAARGANAFALGMDFHLPTGDDENMLGTGGTQAQFYLIASSTHGKLAPHVNAGFTAAGGSDNVNNQFNYVAGTEYAASPKLTLVGDFIGRTYTGAQRITDTSILHNFQQANNAPVESTTLNGIEVTDGSISSLLGTVGVKFNPTRNLLISAHGLFSLNSSGLRRGFTPVFGFDYSF